MLVWWISKLETYDYKLEHRREVKHMKADMLSRRPSFKCKRPNCRECGSDVLFLDRDSEDPQHNN